MYHILKIHVLLNKTRNNCSMGVGDVTYYFISSHITVSLYILKKNILTKLWAKFSWTFRAMTKSRCIFG